MNICKNSTTLHLTAHGLLRFGASNMPKEEPRIHLEGPKDDPKWKQRVLSRVGDGLSATIQI